MPKIENLFFVSFSKNISNHMTAGLPSRNLGYVQDMHSAGVLASALHIGINIQRTWVLGARGNVSAGVNWINVKL